MSGPNLVTILEWIKLAKEREPEQCACCRKVMVRGADVGYDPRIRACDRCQNWVLAQLEFSKAQLEGRLH